MATHPSGVTDSECCHPVITASTPSSVGGFKDWEQGSEVRVGVERGLG